MNQTMINIGEAKTRFSHYTRRVKNGETIIICDRNRPFAELRPLPAATGLHSRRPFGLAKGQRRLPEDFNKPDPEIEALFCGESG